MAELTIDIVTPTALVFTGKATAIRVPGWEGEFEVLEGHDTLLSLLRGGITTVTTASGETRYITGRGFVEAGPDRVTLLADSCILASEADKTTAHADIEAGEAIKLDTFAGSAEWDAAEEKAELARARLEA